MIPLVDPKQGDSFQLIAVAKNEAETARIGAALVESMEPGAVLILTGDLGAGKTTLIKSMAQTLGIDPSSVRSPTFTIVHEYREGRLPLIHMDVYRLDGVDAFDDMGGYEYLDQNRGLVAIEWGELIVDGLEPGWLQLKLEYVDDRTGRAFWAKSSDQASESWLVRTVERLRNEGKA